MLEGIMRLRHLVPLLSLSFVAPGAYPARAQTVPDGFTIETLAPGLASPVGFDFLPDGRVLYAELLSGQVRLLVPGSGVQAAPVVTVPELVTGGERGLLGIAVDPVYPARPYLYVHYDAAPPNHIRIARFTLAGNLDGRSGGDLTADPATRFDLVDDIPDQTEDHNGGTLRFDHEGLLYASVGEDETWCAAQDSTSLRGVILRLRTNLLPPGPGSAFRAQVAAPGNPFAASADSNLRLVAALGLRNPFRFQVDRVFDTLVIGDVGENVREEVDLLQPPIVIPLAVTDPLIDSAAPLGADFGWPFFEGSAVGAHAGDCGAIPRTLVSPIWEYDRTSQLGGAAIISAGSYRRVANGTANWPRAYEADLFASDYYSGDLRRLHDVNGRWDVAPPVPGQPSASRWGAGFQGVSDWRVGPDGALWYCRQNVDFAANTGSIGRITGPPEPPEPPGFSLRVLRTPATGSVALGVICDRPLVVRILDATGRRVRTVFRGDPPLVAPGTEFALSWDGLTDGGERAAPGIYLAELECGGRRAGARIALLR